VRAGQGTRAGGSGPFDAIPAATGLPATPGDRPVLGRCQPGGRSTGVTSYLLRQGWEDVGNVAGGIDGWQRMGLPVRRGPVEPGEGQLSG